MTSPSCTPLTHAEESTGLSTHFLWKELVYTLGTLFYCSHAGTVSVVTCAKESEEVCILKRAQASEIRQIRKPPLQKVCPQNESILSLVKRESRCGWKDLSSGSPQEEHPNLLQQEHPIFSDVSGGHRILTGCDIPQFSMGH